MSDEQKDIIIKERSGYSWDVFYEKLNKIIMGSGDDDEKLWEISRYIDELNEYGGFGEVETITIIRYAGNLCFKCANLYNNCAIHVHNRNQTECEWFKEKEGI